MGVKGAFDHVSKGQLIKWMIELGVDGNLIIWKKLILTDLNLESSVTQRRKHH